MRKCVDILPTPRAQDKFVYVDGRAPARLVIEDEGSNIGFSSGAHLTLQATGGDDFSELFRRAKHKGLLKREADK